MRLLVTRPEPDNVRTAEALRALGHEAILAPLLRIESVMDADLGAPPWSAVLLTSANGARAIAGHRRFNEIAALPVLAVGRGSAEAAHKAGFTDVSSADGDAGDLARLAATRFKGETKPLLYLAGEDRARDLGGELAVHGLSVRTVAIYRAAKVELPADVQAALTAGRIDGVLHFSRRSVESYLECSRHIAGTARAPMHYCLSARAAEPLLAARAKVQVAERPDEASLVALVTPLPRSNRLE